MVVSTHREGVLPVWQDNSRQKLLRTRVMRDGGQKIVGEVSYVKEYVNLLHLFSGEQLRKGLLHSYKT